MENETKRNKSKIFQFYAVTFIIVFFIILIACIYKNPVTEIVNSSSKETNFSPTFLEIYDKSTEDECNRLIVVYPFRWAILCYKNKTYVVDLDSPFSCPSGLHPGLKLHQSNNVQVICLSISAEDAKQRFSDVPPTIIDYDLEGVEKFTILDAINMCLDLKLLIIPHEEMDDSNFMLGSKMDVYKFNNPKIKRIYSQQILKRVSNKEKQQLRNTLSKFHRTNF